MLGRVEEKDQYDALVMGMPGDTSTAAQVLRSLAGDPDTDSDVRQCSALALGQLGDTSTATLEVLRSLARDPDSDVRRFSAPALGQFGQLVPPHPDLVDGDKPG